MLLLFKEREVKCVWKRNICTFLRIDFSFNKGTCYNILMQFTIIYHPNMMAPGRFFDGHIIDGHIIDGHIFDGHIIDGTYFRRDIFSTTK